MPLIDAPGARLHVVDLGERGRLTVMLHGLLLGNVATWYFTTAPVLAMARRVRLFDLRGHGRSERPATGYDLATMAGDLDAVVGDTQEPVDLVGHSYGALVALTWALAHPDRVRRLVLVEAPPPAQAPEEVGAFLLRDPEEMLKALPDGLRSAVAGGRRQARRLMEHLVGLATETSVLQDLGSIEPFTEPQLRAFEVPTLCIHGDQSACLEGGRALASSLGAGSLEVLSGGHYLHLDAPEALSGSIRRFLDG